MNDRLGNLQAIELSHWPSFDSLIRNRPGKKDRSRVPDSLQLAFLSACIIGLSVLVAYAALSYSRAARGKTPFDRLSANPFSLENPDESDIPEPDPNNPGTISQDEFESLRTGMSYRKVVSITGGEGELLPRVVPAENIEGRYWRSDIQGRGGARLFFTNGNLFEKTWLEKDPGPLTQAQFAQMQRGMTYEQFLATAGSPPSYEIVNANTRVCFWPGDQPGVTVHAVFVDNVCQSVMRSQ